MTDAVWSAIRISLKVATLSTAFGLIPACLLGYVLATRHFTGKALISALTTLPLVLPPTAIGYMLLRLLAVDGPLGRRALGFDLDLLMTYRGAVVASCIMSFPLMVRTAKIAFEAIDPRLIQVAHTLGHGTISTLLRFVVPLAKRGIGAAAIIGFTRALGEFGASVTVAGNIEGRTSTLATAIWSAQEVGNDREATTLIWIALAVGLIAASSSEMLSQSSSKLNVQGRAYIHKSARDAQKSEQKWS